MIRKKITKKIVRKVKQNKNKKLLKKANYIVEDMKHVVKHMEKFISLLK